MAQGDRPDSTIGISSITSDGEQSSKTSNSQTCQSPTTCTASRPSTIDANVAVKDSSSDSEQSCALYTFPRSKSNNSSERNSTVSTVDSSHQSEASSKLTYKDISKLIRSAPPPSTVPVQKQTISKTFYTSMSSSENLNNGKKSTHADPRRGKTSRSHSSSDNSSSSSESVRHRQARPRNHSSRKREMQNYTERHHPIMSINNVHGPRSNAGMNADRVPFAADSNKNHARKNRHNGRDNLIPVCNFQQDHGNEQFQNTSVSCRPRNDSGAPMNRNDPFKDHPQRGRAYATSDDDFSSHEFNRGSKRRGDQIPVDNPSPFHSDSNRQPFANKDSRHQIDAGRQDIENRTHRQSPHEFVNWTPFEIALQQFRRITVGGSKFPYENYVAHGNEQSQGQSDTRRPNPNNPFGPNRQSKYGKEINERLASVNRLGDFDNEIGFNRRHSISIPEQYRIFNSSERVSRMPDLVPFNLPPIHSENQFDAQRQQNWNADSTAYRDQRGQEDLGWGKEYRSTVRQSRLPINDQLDRQNFINPLNRQRSSSRSRGIDQNLQRRAKIGNDSELENDRRLSQNVNVPEDMYHSVQPIAQRDDLSHSRNTFRSHSPKLSAPFDSTSAMWSRASGSDAQDVLSMTKSQCRSQEYTSPHSPNSTDHSRTQNSLHQDRGKPRNVTRRFEIKDSARNTPKSLQNLTRGNASREQTIYTGGCRPPLHTESGLDSEIREEMARARNMDIPFRFDQEPKKLNPKAQTFIPAQEEICRDGHGYPYRQITSRGLSFYHPKFPHPVSNPNYMIPSDHHRLVPSMHQVNIDPTQSVATLGNIVSCQETAQDNTPVQVHVGYQVQANASCGIPVAQNPALQPLTVEIPNSGDGMASIYPNPFSHPVMPHQPHISIENPSTVANIVPYGQTVQSVIAQQVPVINPPNPLLNLNYMTDMNWNQAPRPNVDARENPRLGQEINLPAVVASQTFGQNPVLPSQIVHHSATAPTFVHPQLYHQNQYNPATPAPNPVAFQTANQQPRAPVVAATLATPTVAEYHQQQSLIRAGLPNLQPNSTATETATQERYEPGTGHPFRNVQTYVALMEENPRSTSSALTLPFSVDHQELEVGSKTEAIDENPVQEKVEDPQIVRSVVQKLIGTVKKIEQYSQIPLTEAQLVEVLCGKSVSIVDEVVATYGKCNNMAVDAENENGKSLPVAIQEEIDVDTRLRNDLPDTFGVEIKVNDFIAGTPCLESNSKSDMKAYQEPCTSPITFQFMPELQMTANECKSTLESPTDSYQDENTSESAESGIVTSPTDSDSLKDFFNFNETNVGQINGRHKESPEREL